MTTNDWAALTLFLLVWIGYEPILERVARRSGAIFTDMQVIRAAWMRAMSRRETRLIDGQIMGHVINTASFFASSNLILIAAVAGVLFGGGVGLRKIAGLAAATAHEPRLLQAKLALVLLALVRGLLSFIWAIRQLNYCLAVIGAAPEDESIDKDEYAEGAAQVINPALSAFSHGVRGYYFSLAAAAWLFGPWVFAAVTLGAFFLLLWRQSRSRAAAGLSRVRNLFESSSSPRRP